MKIRRKPLFFSIMVVALVAIAAFLPQLDSSEKEALLIEKIMTVTNSYHYNPLPINNDFSEKVYDAYLDRLDGGKRWLIQSEVDQLEAFKYQLDEQTKQRSYEFLDLAIELVENGVDRSQEIYRSILAEPFDFSVEEVVNMDSDKKPFASSEEELREYWRKSLKYEVMTRVTTELDNQEKMAEKAAEEGEEKAEEAKAPKDFATLEAEARKRVLKLYDDWYNRMAKNRRSDYLSNYLDAVAKTYDPHTGYFAPKDKEDFDMQFKGSFEGIGARLQQDGDFTKVVMIMPGGPASEGKELEEEDVILKVAQGDEEEQLDIKGMRVDDVVQYIRGKKGTKVRLTVKKPDGSIKEIPIVRDVVIIEETYAKSLKIRNDEDENIGYIYLPSFYADFSNKNGRFCSNDVANEIEKLKDDNVSGIILDLRSNGGGGLDEVRKMTGLFIESGPIVQVKSRGRSAEVLKDVDRSVAYDGPLVVLVNNFSASASEILAAALQDYGRAVIVGGTSTFGKGTVQRFVDLDMTVSGNNDLKPLGNLKLTLQKYYRINGGSVQLRGVVPDVQLPDYYTYIDAGERDLDNAMGWSEIDPVRYNQQVYKIDNMEELVTKSSNRVEQDTTFQQIAAHAKWVKEQREDAEFPLMIETYSAKNAALKEKSKQYKDLMRVKVLEEVSNPTADLAGLENAEKSKIERNENFIKSVTQDVYVKEAIQILKDMRGVSGNLVDR